MPALRSASLRAGSCRGVPQASGFSAGLAVASRQGIDVPVGDNIPCSPVLPQVKINPRSRCLKSKNQTTRTEKQRFEPPFPDELRDRIGQGRKFVNGLLHGLSNSKLQFLGAKRADFVGFATKTSLFYRVLSGVISQSRVK